MIAYKVVRVLATGQMRSVFFSKGRCGVLYDMGKTTERPKGQGPIAVFRLLENAREWVHHMKMQGHIDSDCHIAIIRCRVKRSRASGLWHNKEKYVKHRVPGGTIFCDRVTPLKMVMDNVGFMPYTDYSLAA